jgi:hypothetical protein
MASRGFEFVGTLDGSNNPPVVKDLTLGETTDYLVGDIVAIQSDGYADKLTASIGEVTGVMQEKVTGASAGVTKGKVAIVTRHQIWRCSMDAASTSAVVGYTKTVDVADQNTIDADDISNGSLIAWDVSKTDSDGNILAEVVFADTTFGNA